MNKTRMAKFRAKKQHLFVLVLLICILGLQCLSCGGGSKSAPPSAKAVVPPSAAATPLSMTDVQTVVQNAVTAVNAPMVVAVADRAGNILAVFETPDAPTTFPCTGQPNLQPPCAVGNFGATVSADDLAANLARTAAFFSNDQAPLSSRTVRFISGIHFPPDVNGAANADLYGIENTNRGCTLSPKFNPGQVLNPSLALDGIHFGLGIITGKADVNDSDPFAVNPGGVPLFNTSGALVGGVGVVSTSYDIAEYAAFKAAFPSGVLPLLPPPGAVVIGGITVPFVNQLTQPSGTSPGSFAGSYEVGHEPMAGSVPPEEYLVGPNAGSALSASDVDEIIMNAVATASITRAVIRLPVGSRTAMTIAVSDIDGTLLGLFRMHDGTVFSVDVAASKARNVVWFSGLGTGDLAGVPSGTAVTNRTISFGAQPLFPPGIDGSGPGPFFQLYVNDTANPCTQGSQPGGPNNKMSGIVFFPGSLPLYRNGVMVGGLGVSGDGVDQDDFVTASAVNAACGAGGPCGVPDFQASPNIRADQIVIQNVRLPYQKFPRNPTN